MGLFDFDPEVQNQLRMMSQPSEEDKAAARSQALLSLGLGMMANSTGPRGSTGLGQIVGRAGLGSMDDYQRSLMMAQQRKQQEFNSGLQLQKLKRDQFNLPAGMQFGEDGKPTWIPGYIEGQEKLRQQNSSPYHTVISTPLGLANHNSRTGEAELLKIGGVPIMKASDDPSLQGKITGAREQAKTEVELGADSKKAVKRSDTLLEYANEAGAILDRNPTHSGVGAVIDAAGRMVGMSSKSAQDASRLEAISGWMVSNVPRMEGPQSNFDVKNYETMAGKVGDRTVPIEERKAALKTLIDLQNKYRSLNGGDGPNQVTYPKDAGKPGVRVPNGAESRSAILSGELAMEQQRLQEARASGDLKAISEANRNIQLIQKEMGSQPAQAQPAKVRRYNPQTGRIE